jgi:protease IV
MANPVTRILRFGWRVLDGLRRLIHLLLMLLVLVIVLAVFSETPVMVPRTAALVVAPTGVLVEQLEGRPLDRAINEATGDGQVQTLVRDLNKAILGAASDPRIQALVLNLDGLEGGGLIKLQEVADALAEFRESGKRVVAYGGAYDQTGYFLAAQADEVYMHPLGSVFLRGFGFYRAYFGEAAERLSLDINVFRTGEHKSYHDYLTRDDMSDAEKQEIRVALDQLWRSYRDEVGAARGIPAETLQNMADNYLDLLRAEEGDTGRLARQLGLVDELLIVPQVEQRLIEIVGEDPDSGSFNQIDHLTYLDALKQSREPRDRKEVAVIVASGNILPGEQAPGSVGAETFVQLIREARDRDQVAAVVLRLDSGGGSQFASDLIFEELRQLRESGKPVFASMGDLAASGAYLLAIGTDEIWARPDTLTGSIGVTAMLPTADRALARLGIQIDGVGTTRYSGDFSPLRSLSPEASEILQLSVDSSYRRFVEQVAEARGLSVGDVDAVAGGRVWTGRDAQRLGLVDQLGDLQQAVAAAAERSGLGEDYRINFIEQDLSLEETLALSLLSNAARISSWTASPPSASWLAGLLSRLDREMGGLIGLRDPRDIYYHCLCELR